MDKYYLAVDIGASSGRHMLASMKDGKIAAGRGIPFSEWNDRKKRDSLLGCRASVYRNQNGLKYVKSLGNSGIYGNRYLGGRLCTAG